MGIQGLLPVLKSISKRAHVSKYAGKKVAVDAYSWLHKGAYSCSVELCEGTPTEKYVVYCMQKVALLHSCGVIPVIVFDGGKLPMKQDEESTRDTSRRDNLEKAQAHVRAGNKSAAFECYQRAVDISPALAKRFIEALKKEGVEFIVAPYEADSQMAFLAINQHVHAVITEDSDLLAYGCPNVFFKMDKAGEGQEVCMEDLGLNRDLSFVGFSLQMFLEMCILAGCDFLKALPGIGMKKAYQQMRKSRNFVRACKSLRFSGTSVPRGYEAAFQRAIWTFQHQRVFDSQTGRVVHLRPLPEGGLVEAAGVSGALPEDESALSFLGPPIADEIAAQIARGDLDPINRRPFAEPQMRQNGSAIHPGTIAPKAQEERRTLPVQRSVSSFFPAIPASNKCAKRAFAAPRSAPERPAEPFARLSGSDRLASGKIREIHSQPELSCLLDDEDEEEQELTLGDGMRSQPVKPKASKPSPKEVSRALLSNKSVTFAMRFGPSTAGSRQHESSTANAQEEELPAVQFHDSTPSAESSPSAVERRLGLPSSPSLEDIFPSRPGSWPRSSCAFPLQRHGQWAERGAVRMARSGSAPRDSQLETGSGMAEHMDWQELGNRSRDSQGRPQGSGMEENLYSQGGEAGMHAEDPAASDWSKSHNLGAKHDFDAYEGPTTAGRSDGEGHNVSRDGVMLASPAVAHAFYTAITPETGHAPIAAEKEGVSSPVSAAALRHPLALVENTPLPQAGIRAAESGKTCLAERANEVRQDGSGRLGECTISEGRPAKRSYSHFFPSKKRAAITGSENCPAGKSAVEREEDDEEKPVIHEGGAFHSLSHISGYAATASKVIGRLAAQRGMGACGNQSSVMDRQGSIRKPFKVPRPGGKEAALGEGVGRFGKFAFQNK